MNSTSDVPSTDPRPIADMHCDLLGYLATTPGADPSSPDEIGCSIPHLQAGNVKLQVMAIYSGGDTTPVASARRQSDWFQRLATQYADSFRRVGTADTIRKSIQSPGAMIVAAIENASGLCDESEPLEEAFVRLDALLSEIGPILYISLTHHGENRFGGGNKADAGLKDDGKVLLDYVDAKGIAIDLSHTSDALAHGIINHIDGRGLDIPVIASHSNFRSVCNSKRNLPDELAEAVIARRGLIGMNFLRAYLHPDNPSSLIEHIAYGLKIGGQKALCLGADFFDVNSHPDPSRVPYYFKEHQDAGKYPPILESLKHKLTADQIAALAFNNVLEFIERLWSTE